MFSLAARKSASASWEPGACCGWCAPAAMAKTLAYNCPNGHSPLTQEPPHSPLTVFSRMQNIQEKTWYKLLIGKSIGKLTGRPRKFLVIWQVCVLGAFVANSMWIAGHLGELVGYKAGLAFTREDLADHLLDSSYIRDIVLVPEHRQVRVRSEEYEEAVRELLYRVGNTPVRYSAPPILAVVHRLAVDPNRIEDFEIVLNRCLALFKDARENTPQGTSLDLAGLLENVDAELGSTGVNIAIELLDAIVLQRHTSPWMPQRYFDWDNTVELHDLFNSESLQTRYGKFFDQRFIDYLSQNFCRIDEINWRKFEGLTGEFFERAGFRVEMGPGRGDGGVDVRVWAPEDDAEKPPLILVQCKREQQKISQLVVKALWADVTWEGARSGLVVTTSSPTVLN